MRIDACTIPHDAQRYNTVGDYYASGDKIKLRISELGNEDYEFLVLLHELIEEYLCRKAGISDAQITQWDIEHSDHPDPGSAEGCPYGSMHEFALEVEMLVAHKLEVDWGKYEQRLLEVSEAGQGMEVEDAEGASQSAG
jgi:adenylosuccinate lyase